MTKLNKRERQVDSKTQNSFSNHQQNKSQGQPNVDINPNVASFRSGIMAIKRFALGAQDLLQQGVAKTKQKPEKTRYANKDRHGRNKFFETN